MALTITALKNLIDARIIENTTQEISASDLNEILNELLKYANEHDVADDRISSNIARVAAVTNAVNSAKTDVKAELRDGVVGAGDTLKKLYDLILVLSSSTPPAPVPIGLISMWSGSGTNLPAGWALCDGNNGTPNLQGKFVVGYQPGVLEYNQAGNLSELKFMASSNPQVAGKIGGASSHTLNKSNIPTHHHLAKGDGATVAIAPSGSHSHTVNASIHQPVTVHAISSGMAIAVVNTAVATNLATAAATNHTHLNDNFSGQVGSGLADGLSASPTSIDHRPPYYTLAYIMKIS